MKAQRLDIFHGMFSLLCVLPVLCTGCSHPEIYLKDRTFDLLDTIDLKYGYAQGLGAKVEVTEFLGAGLGLGGADSTEWYGRRRMSNGIFFFHLLLIGADDAWVDGGIWDMNIYLFGIIIRKPEWPPWISRFRVGAEIIVPFVTAGLYVNLGEVADFILGFGGIDLASDDYIHRLHRKLELEYRYETRPKKRAELAEKLGELGYRSSVDCLIEALSIEWEEEVREKIAEALNRITGQNFGMDSAKWRRWWMIEKGK